VPDARVRDKQRTCLRPECREEQRRRTQAAYRRRQAPEEAGRRVRSQIERLSDENFEEIRDFTLPVLAEIPVAVMRDVIGPKHLGIMLYLLKLTHRHAQDVMRVQLSEIKAEWARLRSPPPET
jgi:hypothetical protein